MHMLAFLLTLNSAAIANVKLVKPCTRLLEAAAHPFQTLYIAKSNWFQYGKLSNETKANYNCVKILIHEGNIEVSSYVAN